MWDGVTYVDPWRSPIISEGQTPARVIVTNAGPAAVLLRGWEVIKPDKNADPDIELQLWAGNTVTVSAHLLRAKIIDAPHQRPSSGSGSQPFAALAWRVIA